jgi:hypothetical protein
MRSKDTGTSHGDPLDTRITQLESVGTGVLRYGVVFLLVAIGAAKYFAFDAVGI